MASLGYTARQNKQKKLQVSDTCLQSQPLRKLRQKEGLGVEPGNIVRPHLPKKKKPNKKVIILGCTYICVYTLKYISLS
jgi:hypothetical protein